MRVLFTLNMQWSVLYEVRIGARVLFSRIQIVTDVYWIRVLFCLVRVVLKKVD